MKAGSDRKYTLELRDAAVKQVIEGGRGITVLEHLRGTMYSGAQTIFAKRLHSASFFEPLSLIMTPHA